MVVDICSLVGAMVMKVSERDELLGRLDERTQNIWRTLKELKEYQGEQNGFIRENMKRSTKNATWSTAFRWIIGAIGTALIIGLTYLWGLW